MSTSSAFRCAVRRELASPRHQQEEPTLAEREVMRLEAAQMERSEVEQHRQAKLVLVEAHHQRDQLEASERHDLEALNALLQRLNRLRALSDPLWAARREHASTPTLDTPQFHGALRDQLYWFWREQDRVTEQNRSTTGRQPRAGPAVQTLAAARPPPPPPHRAEFCCAVWFDKFPLHALGLELPCDDSYRVCRDCLSRHIETKLGEQQWPIVCPGWSANDAEAKIITRDMAELILAKERLRLCHEAALMQHSNPVTCPSLVPSSKALERL